MELTASVGVFLGWLLLLDRNGHFKSAAAQVDPLAVLSCFFVYGGGVPKSARNLFFGLYTVLYKDALGAADIFHFLLCCVEDFNDHLIWTFIIQGGNS